MLTAGELESTVAVAVAIAIAVVVARWGGMWSVEWRCSQIKGLRVAAFDVVDVLCAQMSHLIIPVVGSGDGKFCHTARMAWCSKATNITSLRAATRTLGSGCYG